VLQHAIPSGALDVVMLTLNVVLQTAAEAVLPLCKQHDVGVTVMMPLNQASKKVGLVSVPAALETVRRLVQGGELPNEPPYTEPTLLDFLEPYSIPEAALRYVLAHDVGTCCVGMRSPERLEQNLRAVDPPYVDDKRLSRLRELFGGIRVQVR
jgi:predicted aldo/keto reductase-like oxidoreductase